MTVSDPRRNRAETVTESENRNHAETTMEWDRNRPKPSTETGTETAETIPYTEGEAVSLLASLNTRRSKPYALAFGALQVFAGSSPRHRHDRIGIDVGTPSRRKGFTRPDYLKNTLT